MTRSPSLPDLIEAGIEAAERDPLGHVSLTEPQWAFVHHVARMLAWVDGNQLGKSFAIAFLILLFIRGDLAATMPRRFRWRPARVLVIGESEYQMVDLMEKLWALADKRELRESCGFEPGRGITGKPPRLVWESGPAKGAEIRFATYGAGSKRIAGGTYDLVVCDEPPSESIIGEIMPRLLRNRGYLRIGFTPVPGMPPQEYLMDYFKRRIVRRMTVGLKVENLIPRGSKIPLLSARRIDEYIGSLLPHHRHMRVSGSLDRVAKARWVPDYDDTRHIQRLDPRKDLVGWTLVVGTDHGTVARKQASVLVAISDPTSARPRIHVLAETVADRVTGPEDDARAILEMLASVGLGWAEVDHWYGDVPTGTHDDAILKSNEELRRELARLTKGRFPPILVVRKHRGSVELECRALNVSAKRDALTVDPRCAQFRASLLAFEGDTDDPVKDVFDAGRYAATQPLTGEIVMGWTSYRYAA